MKSLLCKIFFIGHSWGEWEYRSPDSCEQARVCLRDGEREERILHSWGEWDYILPDSCKQERVCSRDGKREERVLPHNWSEWSISSDGIYQERVCLRCKEVETEQIEYVYTNEDWEKDVKALGLV